MIDPITGLTLAAQAGAGVYQMYKGNKLAKEAEAMQQDYKTPQVIEDSLTNAQIRALEGMPAEMKAQYIQNLQNSTQSGINALSDRKAGISGVEGLLRNEQGSYMNLASQDASMRQANQANLQGVQQNVASYKDREYDLNVLQPYMAKLGAAEAMKGAGLQNLGTVLGSASEMSQNKQLLNDIYGQNKQPVEQSTATDAVTDSILNTTGSSLFANNSGAAAAVAAKVAGGVGNTQTQGSSGFIKQGTTIKQPSNYSSGMGTPYKLPPPGFYNKYNGMTGGFDLTPIGQ